MGKDSGLTLTQTVFEDISDEQYKKKVLDVNMRGVYHGIRVFLPHLRTRQEAMIVNAILGMFPGRFLSILQILFSRMTYK